MASFCSASPYLLYDNTCRNMAEKTGIPLEKVSQYLKDMYDTYVITDKCTDFLSIPRVRECNFVGAKSAVYRKLLY